MKKNVTINLSGRLFQIDEDAYEMLQQYINSLHSVFGKNEGGDEIVSDIESRIAELFEELKQQGIEAITIDHVKDIIVRIGEPEQLDDAEGESNPGQSEQSNSSSKASKRLYRSTNDKMVAGVLSGVAAYTGVSVTLWRIGFVLLALFNPVNAVFRIQHYPFPFFMGTLMLIAVYVIAALALPQADTPERQLQMQGKAVNPQNLANAVVDDKQIEKQSGVLRGILSVLLKICLGFVVVLAIFVCIILCLSFLFVLIATVFALAMPKFSVNNIDLPFMLGAMGLSEVWTNHPAMLICFAIALLTALFIPLYATIHLVLNLTKNAQPMGTTQRIVLILLWLISIGCAIPLGGTIGMYYSHFRHKHTAEVNMWMTDFDRDYLHKNGWKLLKNHDCDNHYVGSGEYFTGDTAKTYLEVWGCSGQQVFQVATEIHPVEPGRYILSCNARAMNPGVYIYATAPANNLKVFSMVPAEGNREGDIWEDAKERIKLGDVSADLPQLKAIADANNGKGYGWSKVEIEFTIDMPTTLTYGLTTDDSFVNFGDTKWDNSTRWFSACDFKLERVGDANED